VCGEYRLMHIIMTSAVFRKTRCILMDIGVREKEILQGIKLTVAIFDRECLSPNNLYTGFFSALFCQKNKKMRRGAWVAASFPQ